MSWDFKDATVRFGNLIQLNKKHELNGTQRGLSVSLADGWLHIDLRDDDEVGKVVSVPPKYVEWVKWD